MLTLRKQPSSACLSVEVDTAHICQGGLASHAWSSFVSSVRVGTVSGVRRGGRV